MSNNNLHNEATVMIHIDSDYNNYIYGVIKYDYNKGERKDKVIDSNKYKNINIENYLLLIANDLWVSTESENRHSLDIIKKNEDYILEVPILEYKKYRATSYWEY